MSEAVTLYVTHYMTGELLGTREAVKDIKQPDRVVVPPYQTPTPLPTTTIKDNEYWAYLDENGKPVRDHKLGNWEKKTRHIKVTAYLKTDCTKTKEFGDKSLVTDEYTFLVPPSPHHDFSGESWAPNINKAIDAKHAEIIRWRDARENESNQEVSALGSTWDSDPESRKRIDSALLAGTMPPYWTDATNVDHVGMTLESLKMVKSAINDHLFAIHDRQRTMKKEVEALTDFDQVLAYKVDWPTT